MANEKRLIDANGIKYREHMECYGHGWFEKVRTVTKKEIDKLPTVDAVEVVRCKDCKYGMKSHCQPPYEERTHLCRHSWEGEYHKPDHFCSYGERKDK